LANTATPLTNAQQPTATLVPTLTPLPEIESSQIVPTESPPLAAVIENTPQSLIEEVDQTVEENPLPTAEPSAAAPPVAVAVAPRVESVRIEGAATGGTQKIAPSTVEPTAPLQVIGAGVVPTLAAEPYDSNITVQDEIGILNSDTFSYLVFVLIVAGLAGLMGFVSLRRRRRA
jgi:hypothetical protein